MPAPAWSWGLLAWLPVFFLRALAEEAGWTGVASRGLQPAWGPLAAGLVIGACWALWHWWPLSAVGRDWAWIAGWSVATVLQRVWMCQLLALGLRSVVWMAALHAVGNLCWQAFPVHGSLWDPVYAIPVHLGIMGALALAGAGRHTGR